MLDKILVMCQKAGMDPSLYFLCYVIMECQTGSVEHSNKYKRILKDVFKPMGIETVRRAVNQGYLERPDTGSKAVSKYHITSKFMSKLMLHSDFDDFWQAYPYMIEKGDQTFILKARDYDEINSAYRDAILANKDLHLEIVKNVEWAVENLPETLTMRIDTFVKSRGWEGIAQIRAKKEKSINKAKRAKEATQNYKVVT